jgi:asparagine synthase (glutamine-hydrolysing)
MCGFIISITKKKIEKKLFSMAFKEIIHRGPDNQTIDSFKHNNLYFNYGFARLAIRDPKKRSNQPFLSKKSNLLFFNGEIYNSNELKKKEKIKTKTSSDTEVLSILIDRYKEKILDKLNGMWAISQIDFKKNNIFISRDRYGVKPLYYYLDKDELVISSTILSIKKLIKGKSEINYDHFLEYLKYNNNYKEKNIFKNIKEFNSSEFKVFDFKRWKFIKSKKYFIIDNVKKDKKMDLFSDFKSSVERRLISDRPVGLMLSGGLDSSLILSCLKFIKKTKNITAYIGYIEKKSNDFIYAQKILQETKIKKRIIKIKNDDLSIDEFKKICKNQETLFPLIGNILSSYQIYKNIRKGQTKVVIDGSGGDEIFSGYPNRYYYFYIKELMKNNFSLFLKNIFNINIFKLKNLIIYILKIYFQKIIFIKKNKYIKENYLQITDPIFSKNLSFNDALKIDAFSGRLPFFLHQLDRNSMSFGLENRSPFLDKNLIKYFNSDYSNKINSGLYKCELRNLFEKFSPLSTSKRIDKSGFSFGRDKFLKKNYSKFIIKIRNSKILDQLINLDKFLKHSDKSNLSDASYLTFFSRLCVVTCIEETIINN